MPSYNLRDILENIQKIKDHYVSNNVNLKTQQKHKIFKEELIIKSPYKFKLETLQSILRIALRLGYITTALEYETDDIGLTCQAKFSVEATSDESILLFLLSIGKELLTDDIEITSVSRAYIDISYIRVSLPPLHESYILYEPLGMNIVLGTYGVVDHNSKTTYIFSLKISNSVQTAIGLGCILPSEILLESNISDMRLSTISNNTILTLPDNKKIMFNNKTDFGFEYNNKFILFGTVTFLKNVLPSSGWFLKVNKRVGRVETILITDCSWGLSSKQKMYVERNL